MDKFSKFSPITIEKLRHQHNQPWEKLHNGQPLREIEEQLSQFELQQQYYKLKTHTITDFSFGFSMLIVLIILYCSRKYLIKTCQKRKTNSTKQTNNEERELQLLTVDSTHNS